MQNSLNELLISAKFAIRFGERLCIGEIGENPASKDNGDRGGGCAIGNAPHQQLPPGKAFVAHHQCGFGEDDVLEQPREEVAPAGSGDAGDLSVSGCVPDAK